MIGQLALSSKENNSNYDEDGTFICTKCGSKHTYKNGINKQGKQKYKCKDCNAVRTNTKGHLMFSSKKDITQWVVFIKSLLDEDSLTVSADKANISIRTAFRWRHNVLYILNNLLNQEVLTELVHLDETVYHVVFKNRNKPNIQEKKKRG